MKISPFYILSFFMHFFAILYVALQQCTERYVILSGENESRHLLCRFLDSLATQGLLANKSV